MNSGKTLPCPKCGRRYTVDSELFPYYVDKKENRSYCKECGDTINPNGGALTKAQPNKSLPDGVLSEGLKVDI